MCLTGAKSSLLAQGTMKPRITTASPEEQNRFLTAWASRVLKESGVTHPPVPIRAVAAYYGVKRIVRTNSINRKTDSYSSAVLTQRDGEYIIALHGADDANRMRFSIAHELAHLLAFPNYLEKPSPGQIMAHCAHLEPEYSEGLSGTAHNGDADHRQLEKLCNKAAGMLLMPDDWFMSLAEQQPPSINSVRWLAQRFGVSVKAVVTRIGQLPAPVWPCVLLVSRYMPKPDGTKPNLRISWFAKPSNLDYYVPRFKSILQTCSIHQAYTTGRVVRNHREILNLGGGLRGEFMVESARFSDPEGTYVLTVLRKPDSTQCSVAQTIHPATQARLHQT